MGRHRGFLRLLKVNVGRCALAPMLTLSLSTALAQVDAANCLYSFTVGPARSPVEACGQEDPAKIGEDPRIRQAMAALGIPAGAVVFRGCAGQPFSAAPHVKAGTSGDLYVVTYPTDLPNLAGVFVAPVVHELAHVMQMRSAGGLDKLRSSLESRQIELGADFLAGLIFATALNGSDMKDFLLNLSLVGSYRVREEKSHGTPEQRTSAFRLGAFRKPPHDKLTISKSAQYFLDNDYARVLAY